MNREKVYYSDPLFEELIANVPADISREFSLRHDVAARIEEIIRRKGWSQADFAKAMNKKESEISKDLNTKYVGKNLFIYNEVNSTNTLAKFLSANGAENGSVVISEKQTAARGRSGKAWKSERKLF